MKKGGFLRNVLDTIRSNQTNQAGQPGGCGAGGPSGLQGARASDFGGLLKPQHFSLGQVARHGFPEQPSALAFDPVQKIAAIGTKSGALRVFGRPGVDVWAQHKPDFAVTHIRFVVNQGAIITVTSDECIHLWSLRGSNLKLQLSTQTSCALASSPSSSSPPAGQQHQPTNPAFRADSDAQPGDPDYLLGASQFDAELDAAVAKPAGAAGSAKGRPGLAKESRQPELLHTLKFQREHITCLHQTLMSKWLYIGTERGNVHVANIETFELSGYQIAWNKAIELSRKTHPGAIIHISECPQDSNKLLLGFESGCIVLWDLKNKSADGRYYQTENLLWLAWHHEGKQFVGAHSDGSLVTWQTRSNARPSQTLQPHAKTSTPSTYPISASSSLVSGSNVEQQDNALSSSSSSSSHHQQSSFARALNNEFYQPILKVDWRTTKSNEQFLLFSGGLPCDGLATRASQSTTPIVPAQASACSPLPRPGATANLSANNQYLKASTTSTASPSPTCSPNERASSATSASGRQSACSPSAKPVSKASSFRPTSLTVMCGKSITVLEMDDSIVDFITVCDSSPYDNDTTDPYAIIVLLANDLILIDLTSPGYPSFESPYPATQLSESPVTCVQYLADCSSDLIPYLYSTSKNFISRAPKKGFSDKEWPINGGEWGQSMQSYPELVLTGHADGTIKFWDMSGVNFDLISKLKTSKLFERPNKLANSVILPFNSFASQQLLAGQPHSQQSSGVASLVQEELSDLQMNQLAQVNEDSLFAIEKLEYCSISKRLLVAGAGSQVIQFKLSKQQSAQQPQPQQQQSQQQQQQPSSAAGAANELAIILVEQTQVKHQQHLIFRARNPSSSVISSSSSSSANSSNRPKRSGGTSGFQAELICLTPMQVLNTEQDAETSGCCCYCVAPPKVTALGLQAEHNILAYTHENGVVLVDLIQKCVIMNATMSDLYGGNNNIMVANRDISIQPFATSSILQHHYQSVAAANSLSPSSISSNPNIVDPAGNLSRLNQHQTGNHNSIQTHSDNTSRSDHNDNAEPSDQVSANTVSGSQTRNSMFQRQLSQSALGSLSSSRISGQSKAGQRALFQRQMTASQLLASSGQNLPLSNAASQQNLTAHSAQSGSKQRGAGGVPTTKNKRIISRMLSISAIHTGPSLLSSQNDSLANSESASCQPGALPANGGSSIIQQAATLSAAELQQDKIDSSFTRSRSSSGSSSTQHPQQVDSSSCAESILCLCFHDYTTQNLSRSPVMEAGSTTAKSLQADSSSGAQIALWLGTSQGCVLLICLTMPDSEDNRVLQLQSVNAEPIPQAAVRLPGAIQCLATFISDVHSARSQVASSGGLSSASQSSSLEGDSTSSQSTPNRSSAQHQLTLGSSSSSLDPSRGTFLAVVSSKQALVYQIPLAPAATLTAGSGKPMSAHNNASSASSSSGQDHHHFLPSLHSHSSHHKEQQACTANDWPLAKLLLPASQKDSSSSYCIAKVELSDTSFACRSALVHMRHPDEHCLVSFLATGNLLVHSLPRLRQLMDTDFVACSSAKIGASMCMSRQGHCLYQPSSSEICKFTISSQYKALVNDMTGSLYVSRDMPEMPRTNFFRSLFGSVASSAVSKQSDRDELFGECSAGKPSRGVAKHIGSAAGSAPASGSNPAGLDKLKGAAMGAMGHDMRLAREGLDERGEKLSEIEDRTFQMMHQSESYAQTAHQLAQKFKDKKWYQF